MISTTNTLASDLQVGMVVHSHGMRLELLTKLTTGENEELPCYSHVGRILNVEEVNAAGLVPESWRMETRPQYVGTPYYSELPDRWVIQSNDLVRWAVEA